MTIEKEYFSFLAPGLLPLICNESVEGAMSQSFYVFNIYKFTLKEFQDNLYTMDNLEIMGDDNGFGRNSYSSCIYVCMCVLVRWWDTYCDCGTLLLRYILDRYICTNKATSLRFIL